MEAKFYIALLIVGLISTALVCRLRVTTNMETKYYIALLILGLISTTLAGDGRHHHWDYNNCPPPIPSLYLPFICTVTDKCSTVTCSAKVGGETLMLDLKIDKSQDPLSADIRLKVEKRNFDWSSSFKSGDKHQVQGFPLTIKGLKDADMFLTLTMARTARGIAYELDLFLDSQILDDLDVPLLKGKLLMTKYFDDDDHDDDVDADDDDDDYDDDNDEDDDDHDDDNGDDDDDDDDDDNDDDDDEGHKYKLRGISWFKSHIGVVKAAIIISALLGVLLLLIGLYYCYKKRHAPRVNTVIDQPPSYDEATTAVKTKVPLEPLANKE